MMGLESSLKEIAQHETAGMFGACSRQLSQAASGGTQSDGDSGVSLATGNEEGYRHMRYRASSVVAGTKLEALIS